MSTDQPHEIASGPALRAQRVFLGRVDVEDSSAAVARRLRTAIGLGYLGHGDRLPREADLARQLGVTAFSLREALSHLRAEGLILTRAGKHGGSFVQRPTETDSLAGEALMRLSATELRDLGDWRTMLATQAASLAAKRASPSTISRLASCAQDLRDVTSATEARRALGHFHMELAVASQSARLSRAEMRIHEEFDWLLGITLDEKGAREEAARSMDAVIEAVAGERVDDARTTAHDLMDAMISRLARTRMSLVAGPARDGRPVSESSLAEELQTFTSAFTNALADLASDVAPVLLDGERESGVRSRVARTVARLVDRLDAALDGVGILTEVGVVPDRPYYMAWWQRDGDGVFALDDHHVLDETRDDFYDYTALEYFVTPRSEDRPWAMGPYIDVGGVDDYLITISVPIRSDGHFLGIAAADLRVSALEKRLAPWLLAVDEECLLLNSESRVIVSNTVSHHVGDVVRTGVSGVDADALAFQWRLVREAGTSSTSPAPLHGGE